MKIIFVSGAYRSTSKAGITRNINHAKREAHKLFEQGWAVICPHTNSAHFPGDDSVYLSAYLLILSRCDAVWMLRGWEKSLGARCELELAKQLEKDIYYE
jgi:hypothetical protein